MKQSLRPIVDVFVCASFGSTNRPRTKPARFGAIGAEFGIKDMRLSKQRVKRVETGWMLVQHVTHVCDGDI